MNKERGHNKVEKIVFAWGILVVLALISFLVYQILQPKDSPPKLKFSTNHQQNMEDYAFKIIIENEGEETAKNVNLKLTLYQNGKSAGSGTIAVNYVPVNSKETAWIVFDAKPKPGDSLVVSPVTYTRP